MWRHCLVCQLFSFSFQLQSLIISQILRWLVHVFLKFIWTKVMDQFKGVLSFLSFISSLPSSLFIIILSSCILPIVTQAGNWLFLEDDQFFNVFIKQKKNIFVFILITEKPILVPLIKSVDLFETNIYVYPCTIISGNLPVSFRWFKDDQVINDYDGNNNERQHRIEFFNNLSLLTLKNLTKHDSCTYRCQVDNAFGSDSSISVLKIKGFIFLTIFFKIYFYAWFIIIMITMLNH